jgi:hypothetical protein
MADLYSQLFSGLLADTIAWCRLKAKPLEVVSHKVRHRQASYALAEHQWNEAIQVRDRDGLRSVVGIEQYKNASALLKEVRDGMGPMDRIFRSPELKPSFSLDEFGDDTKWGKAVGEVVSQRAGFVVGLLDKQSVSYKGGRFLLYTPAEDLACGAADQSSNGFFDTNNVPPWDLWLGFSDGTLVSWVPPALIDVASMGIFVNPEECLRWVGSN